MGLDADALVGAAESALATGASHEDALGAVVELLRAERPAWDWVGIYLLAGDTLVVGPYVGAPTEHTRIPVGRGVCGTAVATESNQVVDDVTSLGNYLACSTGTRSEIVVLIRHDGRIVGQIDVDSDQPGAFGAEDEALLARVAEAAASRCAALVATRY